MLLKQIKLLMLLVAICFSELLFAASGTSVGLAPQRYDIYHSDIDLSTTTTVSPTTSGQCPNGYLAINSNQSISNYDHKYVKDVRTNWNNLPYGWNYTSTSTKNRPSYGITCQKLETNLEWVRGAKP